MKLFEQWKKVTLVVYVCFLSGCGAVSEPSKFYLLNSLSPSDDAIVKVPLNLAIGIGPVDIPEYVDRPQIVTRVSANELNLDEFHKWAEPLKKNIPQVLADNVSVLMKTDHVASYPWKRTTQIDYQVTVDITRMDTAPDGEAHLIARWQIFGEDTRTVLDTQTSHFTASLQGTGYAAVVSAINQTISDLSRSIGKSIISVHSKIKKKE